VRILTGKQFIEEQNETQNKARNDEQLDQLVLDIIDQVRSKGDESLRALTKQYDGVQVDDLVVSAAEFSEARELVSQDFIDALHQAHENIHSFHKNQTEKSWFTNEGNGILLGQKVSPLDSVGIYVPGGKAAYPSTVLMNVIPAKLAGVPTIAISTPPQQDRKINPHVLVAAEVAGVDRVYKVGGAQAIAALAYGTDSVQKVVKIVGPGNAFVACAKKWVFGDVAIDMIAGPSEICIVADDTAIPRFAAADLLSQAEHDEQATALCITTSESFAKSLQAEVQLQMKTLERRSIIEQSIQNQGRIILVDSMAEATDLVNQLAPEHLQLMVEQPFEKMLTIKNAGAIFLGNYSPEALGDYVAGPNHTLPTSGTATFSSPLGVYDFIKRSSIIQYSEQALERVSKDIMTLANAEGLTAHADSIKKRTGE